VLDTTTWSGGRIRPDGDQAPEKLDEPRLDVLAPEVADLVGHALRGQKRVELDD
jgi:hypothetical protein